MVIDLLLEPVSPELVCGSDPEDYESDKALYEAFSQLKSKLDGEMKNGVKQPPRWPDIQKEAFELAQSTKHLHLAVILTDCGLALEGFSGFCDGLRLIREWCERFWKDLYPREMRHSLIDSLSHPRFLMKPRRVILAKGPGGSFSFEDYEKAVSDEKSDDLEAANQARLVRGTFHATPKDQHASNLIVIETALAHARAVEETFDREAADGTANLMDLRDLLGRMAEALRPLAAAVQSKSEIMETAAESAAFHEGANMSKFTGGAVGSREHAGEQLELLAQYFEKNEPSSPIPYMLRRARRCIGMSFIELVDELAPDKGHALQVLKPETVSEVAINE